MYARTVFLVLRAHRIKGTFPENRKFGQVLCDFRKGHSFSTQILMHGPQLRAHFRKYWYDATGTSTALSYPQTADSQNVMAVVGRRVAGRVSGVVGISPRELSIHSAYSERQ